MNTPSINNKLIFNPNPVKKLIAKIGKHIPDKVQDFCDLTTKASPKRLTQFGILAFCVVVGRYMQARDEDEKREILTRDTGMLLTIVYAVPILQKIACLFVNKKTGIPLSCGSKKLKDNINLTNEKGIQMASYKQLEQWFKISSNESYKNIKHGFAGFCKNIKDLGGNVIKNFEVINKNSRNIINNISKSLGYKKEITNKNIIGLLKIAEKSKDTNVQQNLNILKNMFVGENKLLTRASHMKSIIATGSIGLTAFTLGGLLPWFNIQYTKHLYETKQKKEGKAINNTPSKPLSTNNADMIKKFKKFENTGNLT